MIFSSAAIFSSSRFLITETLFDVCYLVGTTLAFEEGEGSASDVYRGKVNHPAEPSRRCDYFYHTFDH